MQAGFHPALLPRGYRIFIDRELAPAVGEFTWSVPGQLPNWSRDQLAGARATEYPEPGLSTIPMLPAERSWSACEPFAGLETPARTGIPALPAPPTRVVD